MNVYIGNLNYRVKEENLRHVLEEYGTVDSVKVIKDRDTGHSKGYAFAEMPDDDEARSLIEGLNGAEFQGRQLVVKEALPKK
jgi:RNA recognition motif-containing protein